MLSIANVEEIISTKKPIVFCGAGISYNSGIPTVDPLIEYIFMKLGMEKTDIARFIQQGFVFERIMEYIQEKAPIDSLLQVFNNNKFNLTHLLLAKLAKKKYIDLVITTNFDENIENAFLHEGLVAGKDFNVINLASETLPEKMVTKPTIIKLHGSIGDLSSIKTTISKIAESENVQPISDFFRFLFSQRQYTQMVFLGYSFSDQIDIIPSLVQEYKSTIQLIDISYKRLVTNGERSKSVPIQTFSRSITKEVIVYDTDVLVEVMHKKLFGETGSYSHTMAWEPIVDNWFEKDVTGVGLNNPYSILWELFSRNQDLESLDKYLSKFDPTTINDNYLLHIDYLTKKAIGKSPNESISLYESAIAIARANNSVNNVAVHLGNLGNMYGETGNLQLAIQYLKECIAYFEMQKAQGSNSDQLNASQLLCGFKSSLAKYYRDTNQFALANEVYDAIFNDPVNLKFQEPMEFVYYGKAKLSIIEGNHPQALACFYECYGISKRLKLHHRIYNSFKEICRLEKQINNENAAMRFYNNEFDEQRNISGKGDSLAVILR